MAKHNNMTEALVAQEPATTPDYVCDCALGPGNHNLDVAVNPLQPKKNKGGGDCFFLLDADTLEVCALYNDNHNNNTNNNTRPCLVRQNTALAFLHPQCNSFAACVQMCYVPSRENGVQE